MQTTEQSAMHGGSMTPAGQGAARRDQPRTTHRVLAGTYSIEGLAGAGVVTLTIIALAHILPVWLTGISVIVAGGAFLVEGAGLGARSRQIRHSLRGTGAETTALASGVSTQLLAGAAGVALGILALAGIATDVLLAVSAIVFGAAFMLELSATHELGRYEKQRPYEASVAYEAVHASNGARTLVGAGAIALGILGLIGVGPAITLVTIAQLTVGAMLFLSGTAIGSGEANAAHRAA